MRERRAPGGGGPPERGGSGDGGGSGGGDDGEPGRAPRAAADPRPLGLLLVCTSIATLFAIFAAAGSALTRRPVLEHLDVSLPPPGLWVSTLVLAVSSVALELGRLRERQGRRVAAAHWLRATTLLGALFVALQAWIWRDLLARGLRADSDARGVVFYSLTGLHALHVAAGLASQIVVRRRLARPFRGASGLTLCAAYWHFMGVLWLALFALLGILA